MPTFTTPEPIGATIELALGNVRLMAGDRDTTVVEVLPSDASNDEDSRAADQTRVEFADDRLLVKAPRLRSWLAWTAGGSIDVTVELPVGSDVHGALGSADVHCSGRLGDCRFRTGVGHIRLERAKSVNLKSGSGDISVDHAAGHADVIAGSGDVRVRELGGTAVVKNSNGDTWIGIANDELRVRGANGDITVDRALAGVGAKSANGDVRLREVTRGSVVLETRVGDLEVGIPEGTSAWLDVSATAGTVHNALDAADGPDPSIETVSVRARTTMGEIVIRRPQGAIDAM
jgi:hypothetical protein